MVKSVMVTLLLGHIGMKNISQWNDFYVNFEYVSFQLKVSGVNCYNYPRCWSMFKKFYRQILLTESVNHPIGPLGTFVSHFASAMGGSFR